MTDHDTSVPEDEDLIPPIPPPEDDWWRLTPGQALEQAFHQFEQGVAYYGLDQAEFHTSFQLDKSRWQRLRQVYVAAQHAADVAKRLLKPQGGSVVIPPNIAAGRKAYEAYEQWFLDALLIDNQSHPPPPPNLSLDSPAADWCLYRTTLLFELTRVLPGIGGRPNLEWEPTTVSFDHLIHERLRTLLTRLVHNCPAQAQPYLERTARCYLLGLSSELAMVARATLEVALRNMRQIDQDTKTHLEDLISQSAFRGMLTTDAADAAHRVRNYGNDAAHGRAVPTADTILRDLATALGGIVKRDKGGGLTSA